MRKWFNGELIEGTPEEIAEYERIVSGKKPNENSESRPRYYRTILEWRESPYYKYKHGDTNRSLRHYIPSDR